MTEQNNMQENMMEQVDPVLEYLRDLQTSDAKIADTVINEILTLIKNHLENTEGFETKHGYIALARSTAFLTQTMCKDQDEFLKELDAAKIIVDNKVFPAIMPKCNEDGEIIEEYDNEDLSVRRLMLIVSNYIDAIFWRLDMNNYQQIRENDDSLAKVGDNIDESN